MNYNLTINKIEVIEAENNLTDIVKHVTWTYTGTEGDQTVTRQGGNNFTYDPNNFIPFSDLTNAQVTQWCLNQMETDGLLSSLQEDMANELNDQPQVLVERTLST